MNKPIKKKILLFIFTFFVVTSFFLTVFVNEVKASTLPSCGFTAGSACGDWGNVGCNLGTCQNQMYQTRLCCDHCLFWECHSSYLPTGHVVDYNYVDGQCVSDSSCVASSRTCNCGSWNNASCGAYSCPSSQRGQIQYCNWSDGSGSCGTPTQCVSDSSCVNSRTCNCGSWNNASCGAYNCPSSQLGQYQNCYYSDASGSCGTNTRCVSSSSCQSAPSCYTSGTSCSAQGGSCGNYNSGNCNGTVQTGLCPSGSSCVCCIPSSGGVTPTSAPPPGATPTSDGGGVGGSCTPGVWDATRCAECGQADCTDWGTPATSYCTSKCGGSSGGGGGSGIEMCAVSPNLFRSANTTVFAVDEAQETNSPKA